MQALALVSAYGRPLAALRPRPAAALRRGAAGAAPARPRRPAAGRAGRAVCYKAEGGGEGGHAPHDLDWHHVAREVKTRLKEGMNPDKLGKLQAW